MIPYTPPTHKKDGFNCPHCGAFAHQSWSPTLRDAPQESGYLLVEKLDVAYCQHCQKYSCWQDGKMIYPVVGTAPIPNPDLPGDVKRDYEEARSIASLSPRGAAALLRLAIQKLCRGLGEKGEDLNDDIASLVKKGLHGKVQKALDSVRVIGTEAVHPGQMDLRDDADTAGRLFGLLNVVADAMISQPKHVDEIYEGLPESKRKAIESRDAKD